MQGVFPFSPSLSFLSLLYLHFFVSPLSLLLLFLYVSGETGFAFVQTAACCFGIIHFIMSFNVVFIWFPCLKKPHNKTK